ncbi:MAG: glycosyltransferase [Patescibacteria group bacterium]|nr:glycosyltransferase [Patescibacteria group bacterium]MDE2227288.1 glycosyltransferase [Patescibacteria group bacterium]
MLKLGLIFNNSLRKDTTGNYCLTAFKEMGDMAVEHLMPGQPSADEKDWYLVIDDGVPFDWSYLQGKKTAYWAIDTHLGLNERLANAAHCQKIFIAQKNDVDKFTSKGMNAIWLPLACDPGTHKGGVGIKKEYDVCFVGHTDPSFMERRVDMLDALFKAVPNFYYGQKFFREATAIYERSKIVFNCSVKNDVNMRCFEAAVSGSLLLTDRIKDNGMENLFADGVHMIMYDNAEEMVEKARYYLAHEKEREEIAARGQTLILDIHTYSNRMYRIIGELIGGH